MSFLPIVDRELRISSRRPGTYRMRWILVLTVLILWFLLLANTHWVSSAQRGKMLFVGVGILAFAFSLFSGVFLTADCLSYEKREGTLGFLFLTNLRGYDVVAGKLLATSLRGFFALTALFPILAITLFMGGVTGLQIWKTSLALLNGLFFSLAAGLMV